MSNFYLLWFYVEIKRIFFNTIFSFFLVVCGWGSFFIRGFDSYLFCDDLSYTLSCFSTQRKRFDKNILKVTISKEFLLSNIGSNFARTLPKFIDLNFGYIPAPYTQTSNISITREQFLQLLTHIILNIF